MAISAPNQDAGPSIIHLHAELLPNIRQVTLYISLPENRELNDVTPAIFISESRRAVTISYPEPFDDITETVKLPARVSEASRRGLRIDEQKREDGRNKRADDGSRRELSFRMQLDDTAEESNGASRLNPDDIVDDYVPWTASDMAPSTKVRCKECANVFLDKPTPHNDAGTGLRAWIWKDLPSGNWAEMMDFWHCHKPDPPKGAEASEEANAQVKGYGAANRVVAVPGTVLVDVATFLVAGVDCLGLEKVDQQSHTSSRKANVNCSRCSALIGMEDIPANGWRLLKTSLAVNTQPGEESMWESHSTENLVAAQLLELIERESIRRFVVHCGGKSGLLLWVFNPDLRYSSSSARHSSAVQRAMKVFFQDVPDIEALLSPGPGKATLLSLEELELPPKMFHALSDTLVGRNSLLPLSAREFREWRVGLLNRFEKRVSS